MQRERLRATDSTTLWATSQYGHCKFYSDLGWDPEFITYLGVNGAGILGIGDGDTDDDVYPPNDSKTTPAQGFRYVANFSTNPVDTQVLIADGTTGKIKPSGYTIAKSVPSDAVFTDTKNTAGSTDTSSKIFLVGATAQVADSQTYSDNEVYTTSGVLTTKSVQVGGGSATMQYNSTTKCIDFIFS